MKACFTNINWQILEILQSTERSVSIAVAWFTNKILFERVLELVQDGKLVELILNNDQINNRVDGIDLNEFVKLGGKLYFADKSRLMHHKFALVDDGVLIFGSYNWTYRAEFSNVESIIISDDQRVIKQFEVEFSNLKEVSELQNGVIPFAPKVSNSSETIQYLKEDYVSAAFVEKKAGNFERSIQAIKAARKIGTTNQLSDLEQIIEIIKNLPKYYYQIEDGQFSGYFMSDCLYAKEGEIFELKQPSEFIIDESGVEREYPYSHSLYVLFIEGNHVECIGCIERDFPKTMEEHTELKQRAYAWHKETHT